jgi:hypothetical protein
MCSLYNNIIIGFSCISVSTWYPFIDSIILRVILCPLSSSTTRTGNCRVDR